MGRPLVDNYIPLVDWCRRHNRKPHTAREHFHKGRLPGIIRGRRSIYIKADQRAPDLRKIYKYTQTIPVRLTAGVEYALIQSAAKHNEAPAAYARRLITAALRWKDMNYDFT